VGLKKWFKTLRELQILWPGLSRAHPRGRTARSRL
jgi:hypothetical protein